MMNTPAASARPRDHPPKPRLALSVGVIGHRPNRLPKDQPGLTAIRAEADQTLHMLAVAACGALVRHQSAFAVEPTLLSVVSGLAEGADRIAALAVTERRAKDFQLDVALPFATDEYKKDFKQPDSQQEFDKLCAAARAVLTLPGSRKNADDPDDPDAQKAYEAVGFTIISQSDILLTIWDGGPSGGRGGTTEMLNTAARLGIPIIQIDATGASETCIRWNALDEYPVPVNAAEDLNRIALSQKVLDEVVDTLVRLPKPKSPSRGWLRKHYDEATSLAAYYKECFWRIDFWFLHRFPYPCLLAAFVARWLRRNECWPPRPEQLADQLSVMAPPVSNAKEDEGGPDRAAVFRSFRLTDAYGWADSVGTRFALIFRSAFVLNFLLAAGAVVAAALSLVTSDPAKPQFVGHLVEHKVPCVVAELLLILIVLLNTVAGWLGRWHPRWIESREVAERLRVALPLWVLGTRPAVFRGEEPTWTGWYARAIIRAQGLRHVTFSPEALKAAQDTLLAVLEDQRDYHRGTTQRMKQLECRLEAAGLALFIVTFLAVVAFLAAYWGGWNVAPWWAYAVTAIAAGLPALATALYGIRVIGDFDGIAKRSKRMCEDLKRLTETVKADWPAGAGEAQKSTFALLRARARAAETAMLSDVQNWRLAAESRELTIPG